MYLSPIYAGKTHDFSIFKELFKGKDFGKIKQIFVDLGFIGIKDYISHNNNISIPHKKPKGGALTEKQKEENITISRNRIGSEHTIGGIKRYFITRIDNRSHSNHTKDLQMELCSGLWNFKISVKNKNISQKI